MADAVNINVDEIQDKVQEQARKAQDQFENVEQELLEPKGRCQCVGHTLLWGGVIVAALAGLCAIGRWLKS